MFGAVVEMATVMPAPAVTESRFKYSLCSSCFLLA